MSNPKRIQLSRQPGFNLQQHSQALNGLAAVKCDRTTRFGNPYVVGEPVDRKQVRRWGWRFSPQGLLFVSKDAPEAVARFAHCLIWDEAIHGWLRDHLGGKNLACWCAPHEACHVDPLLHLANSTELEISAFHKWTDAQIMRAAARVAGGA